MRVGGILWLARATISLYRLFCRRKNWCLIESAWQHYEEFYIQYIMGIFLGDLVDSENYYYESQSSWFVDILELGWPAYNEASSEHSPVRLASQSPNPTLWRTIRGLGSKLKILCFYLMSSEHYFFTSCLLLVSTQWTLRLFHSMYLKNVKICNLYYNYYLL